MEELQKRAEEVCRFLDLAPVGPITQDNLTRTGRFLLVKTKDGEDRSRLLKINVWTDEVTLRQFRREIMFTALASKSAVSLANFVPGVVAYSLDGPHPWAVLDYIAGQTPGRRWQTFAFQVEDIRSFFERVVAFLDSLEQVSSRPYWESGLRQEGIGIPPQSLDWYLHELSFAGDGTSSGGRVEALLRRRWPLLSEADPVLCHADLAPQNILTDGTRLWVIDWENIHYEHRLFDMSFVWLMLWPHPGLQRKLDERLRRGDSKAWTVLRVFQCERELRYLKSKPASDKLEEARRHHQRELSVLLKDLEV